MSSGRIGTPTTLHRRKPTHRHRYGPRRQVALLDKRIASYCTICGKPRFHRRDGDTGPYLTVADLTPAQRAAHG